MNEGISETRLAMGPGWVAQLRYTKMLQVRFSVREHMGSNRVDVSVLYWFLSFSF